MLLAGQRWWRGGGGGASPLGMPPAKSSSLLRRASRAGFFYFSKKNVAARARLGAQVSVFPSLNLEFGRPYFQSFWPAKKIRLWTGQKLGFLAG